MSDQGLLPCPFCGGDAEHDAGHYSGEHTPAGHLRRGHAIYCADMGCIGCPAFFKVWDDDEGGFEAAAKAWNTRPPPTTGDNPVPISNIKDKTDGN